MLRHASQYVALGISVIPLRPRSKQPLVVWEEFIERLPTDAELRRWFPPGTNNNIGGVMGRVSRLAAIDADNSEAANRLEARLPATTLVTKTLRGRHFFFRLRPGQTVPSRVHATVLGVPADVRGERSYVVLPESIHPSGFLYQQLGSWVVADAPDFDETWIDPQPASTRPMAQRRDAVRHVDAYLARVESIQGQHGSAGLVRACAICREAGLSEAEATIALLRWNSLPVVSPPWAPPAIARAVTRVYARRT